MIKAFVFINADYCDILLVARALLTRGEPANLGYHGIMAVKLAVKVIILYLKASEVTA
jgi:hypothetical protein